MFKPFTHTLTAIGLLCALWAVPSWAANEVDSIETGVAALQRGHYATAMRAGEECYVARADGVIVHSNWIRFHDNAPLDGRPVDLKPGEVYTTDAHTAQERRGLGIHEAVLMHMLQVAQRRGCHRAYTITDLTKAGSRRGVKRVGWQRRGSILYVTPRGLQRTWLVRLGGDLEPMFDHARASMGADR